MIKKLLCLRKSKFGFRYRLLESSALCTIFFALGEDPLKDFLENHVSTSLTLDFFGKRCHNVSWGRWFCIRCLVDILLDLSEEGEVLNKLDLPQRVIGFPVICGTPSRSLLWPPSFVWQWMSKSSWVLFSTFRLSVLMISPRIFSQSAKTRSRLLPSRCSTPACRRIDIAREL